MGGVGSMAKTPTKKSKTEKLLTEVELEMMRALWSRGSGTVADVQGMLPPERKLAYTSVSTMLRILEQKGVLGSRKEGRGHIYVPKLEKQEYEKRSLRHIVDRVFGGAPARLVQRLLEVEPLSSDELSKIKVLLKMEKAE